MLANQETTMHETRTGFPLFMPQHARGQDRRLVVEERIGQMRVVVASRVRTLLVALAVGLTSLAVSASGAVASKGVVSVFGTAGSGDGQFANAGAAAVDATSGGVYVVDQFDNRIEQFDSSGSFVRAWGWGVSDGNAAFEVCESGCQAGQAGSGDGQFDTPQGIAIDQSDGSVYVVDGNNSRVEKFDSSGTFRSQFGTAGSAEGQLSAPQGIAVDPTDRSVYIVDSGNNRVQKFDHTGAFLNTFGSGVSDGNEAFEVCTSSCQTGLAVADDGGFSGPTRVAVDSTGKVYVLDSGNGRVERFTSADAFDEQFDPADVFAPQELAVDPSNDHLYVAQWAQDFSEQHVIEIDSSGTLIDTHGVGSTATNSSGLAASTNDAIYLVDGFNARVFVLRDLTAPTVSANPATNVTTHSADLSGVANPRGPPSVSWHFEISTDDASWNPATADQDIGSGSSDVTVSASLPGLVPNTTYFVRLVATRPFNAPAVSNEVQFTTGAIAPDVTTKQAQDLSPTHASLQGVIDPNNSPTTYYFEYGMTTAYGGSVPATRDGDAGSANFPVAAIQPVYGLQPATTYHYRLVAQSQVGTIPGADQTFTTTTPPAASPERPNIPGTGFLPDNRAWEQVSPTQKHGSEVMGDSNRTRAAAGETPNSPMAVTFASLQGFGDVQGTNIATEYMAIRTAGTGMEPTGWTTHGITPRQDPLTLRAAVNGLDTMWEGSMSPDLSRGVYLAWSPLTNAPNVASVENLYMRDDLRTPGAGSYHLLTDCPACSSPLPPILSFLFGPGLQVPRFAGASDDFRHVIFESRLPLMQGATNGSPHLYEWENGTLRLAGVLPDSECGSPPCIAPRSQAGRGALPLQLDYTLHTVSSDGSRIFFTVPSSPGSRSGTLYMRVNGANTVQISGTQPATFWTASTDGTRVFFTTDEQLVPEDTDGTIDLYMYDTNAPVGERYTRLSAGHDPADTPAGVAGVIGASDDGRYVYFLEAGQLVAGEPTIGPFGIYEWHDGAIHYVGQVSSSQSDDIRNYPNTWTFLGTRLQARVSPDGRHLLFVSHSGAKLTGYDQTSQCARPCEELYVYSADSHELACASCNPSGGAATADATDTARFGTGASSTTWTLNHALSDDGRHVFFTTAERLVPQDTNGKPDAYEYDVPSGTVHLLSSGRPDTSDTYFQDASADGSDAFFITRQRLVGWDTDSSYDLYDARVGGGLPDPVSSPPCAGDSCRVPGQSPPAGVAPGSRVVSGPGNVVGHRAKPKRKKPKPKPLRCRRGFVKKRVHGRVRCVKRVTHHVRHAPRAGKAAPSGKVR